MPSRRQPRKKPRSVEEDRRNLAIHVRPAIGATKASDVTRQDILRLHHDLRSTPTAANRVRALLHKMFELAEEWGIRPEATNPCRRVPKYKEQSRQRFLSTAELTRLGEVLGEAERAGEHPSALAIIRLLLLTGCRLGEILTLQWSFIDFERGCLRLPDSKTGPKTIHLAPAALDLIAALPRFTSPYVFPAGHAGRGRGAGHFVGAPRVWRRIRTLAGLAGVRIHDLRHTYASHAIMGGMSLYMAGSLLGHRQPATTARYAHLSDEPQQAAAARVGATIAGALKMKRIAGPRPLDVAGALAGASSAAPGSTGSPPLPPRRMARRQPTKTKYVSASIAMTNGAPTIAIKSPAINTGTSTPAA